jgi:hypothetical protein
MPAPDGAGLWLSNVFCLLKKKTAARAAVKNGEESTEKKIDHA